MNWLKEKFKKIWLWIVGLIVAGTLGAGVGDLIVLTEEELLSDLEAVQEEYLVENEKYKHQTGWVERKGFKIKQHELEGPSGERGYVIFLEYEKDEMLIKKSLGFGHHAELNTKEIIIDLTATTTP